MCNALFYKSARLSMKKYLPASLRVGLIKPIQRIHLDAVYPHLPVQVRARDSACASYKTDHLTLLNHIFHVDQNLRLMPESTVNTPAVIDNCRIAPYR